jgi:prepilin-type N-terminal cleavage/methylation domain-containing protein
MIKYSMKAPDNRQQGFSLVELLVVSVILVFVIGMIATIVSNVQSSLVRQRPRTEALNDATASLDMLARLIRQAGNNPNNISGVQGIDPGSPDANGVYRAIRIRSDWRGSTMDSVPDGDINDPFEDIRFFVSNNRLMKQEPSDSSAVVFLENVRELRFNYFDTNNSAVSNPTTYSGLISRIDVGITIQPPSDNSPMVFTTSAFVRQR